MAAGEQIAAQQSDQLISIVPLEDDYGLEIIDHIERRHVSLFTADSVTPHHAETDLFEFPVSKAVTISSTGLRLAHRFGAIIRNSLGFMVAEITRGERRSFPRDRYIIDPGASIKTYIAFDAGFSVESSDKGLQLSLDGPSRIHIGVRSHHKRPAAQITTTPNIQDLTSAISCLGSSLKTMSCERSYPTLRGHPPTIEVGDTCEIPQILDPPDSDVQIELPPNKRYLYAVSPLSFYLGATISLGSEPRIVTGDGYEYYLSNGHGEFENDVEQTLKQIFLLDCLTRTEGLFQVDLYERCELESELNLSFSRLYDASLGEQLEAYLRVPYATIQPYIPRWKLTAHVSPTPSNVRALPFVVNELGIVKTLDDERGKSPTEGAHVDHHSDQRTTDEMSVCDSAETESTIHVDSSDSVENTWISDGTPIGASKALFDSFQNRLGRTPADDDIDITVVCNSNGMGQEMEIINRVYGSRDELPFDVSVHRGLTTRGLTDVLSNETDFLHYIGHIDGDGFECRDGHLDTGTLDSTGVDVFFLNGCTSFEQGRRLIEVGSIAGVVTLNDVINSGAERIGATLARLLNCGFPLQAALNIARRESIMGGNYLVLGDGGIEITQPDGSAPAVGHLDRTQQGWHLRYFTYPTSERGLGTITNPPLEDCNQYYLNSGENGEFSLTDEQLESFIRLRDVPLRMDGELTWPNELP